MYQLALRERKISIIPIFFTMVILIIIYRISAIPSNCYKDFYNEECALKGHISQYISSNNDMVAYKLSDIYLYKENRKYTERAVRLNGAIKLNVIMKKKTNATTLIGDTVYLARCTIRNPLKYKNSKNVFKINYWKSKNIYASVTINQEDIKIIDENRADIFRIGYLLRQRLQGTFKIIPDREENLISSIVYGEEKMSEDDIETFTEEGLSHVMAVSGFNLLIIVGVITYLLQLIRINKLLCGVLCISVCWIFALITGFGESIFRAAIMTSIFMICKIVDKEYSATRALVIAISIMILINPNVIFSISFVLSVGAVLGMILFYQKCHLMFHFMPSFLKGGISATISAQILLIPVLINTFTSFSVVSVITNLIVVPLCSVLTVTGLITSVIGCISMNISDCLNGVNYIIAKLILILADNIHNSFICSINLWEFGGCAITAYYASIVMFFYRKEIKNASLNVPFLADKRVVFIYNYIGIIMVMVFFVTYFVPDNLFNKDCKIYFIDVDQGDGILIKTPGGKNILIDGGGIPAYYNSTFDIGKKVIEPFLFSHRVNRIDLLVATHQHDDHIRGLLDIARTFNVKTALLGDYSGENSTYKEIYNMLYKKHTRIIRPVKGDLINFDDVTLHILNPPSLAGYKDTHSDSNNNSIAIRLDYKKVRMLLTGDMEAEAENSLINSDDKGQLDADVLKIGHHGSRFSSSVQFLKRVSPKFAVISVGRNNYGHPSRKTLKKVKKLGIKLYRTDIDGCVMIYTNGQNIRTEAVCR